MKITKQRLKEIIKEEFERSTPPGDGFGDEDDGYYPERPGPEKVDEAANPEWESADKILRDLVYLAQDLEDSSNAESAALASAIVSKLREAVDAMERRLNDKFAAAEDEVSDEEALELKGNPSQREINRLAYGARTGRWRDR
tara:strand:+ start:732 stop:1157 length:426 start_codon:yes stop_codon:yes gene_type:complete